MFRKYSVTNFGIVGYRLTGSHGNVLKLEHSLRHHQRLLHTATHSQTIDDEVSDPFRMTCVRLKCAYEACTNSTEDRADEKERCVVAHLRYGTSGDQRSNNDGKHQRDGHNA